MILVREADIFLSESLRILAERLSQSEIGLPLRQICYYSPPEDVGVFSTEIKTASSAYSTHLPHNGDETLNIIEASAEYDVCFYRFIVIPCVGSLEYALDASFLVINIC